MDKSALSNEFASELKLLLEDSRRHLLLLVADLDDDQMFGPRLDIVNPPLWEIGHVAWFQERWISRNLDKAPALNASSDDLFNSFEVLHDWRWGLSLPSRDEILRYMSQVLEKSIIRLSSEPLNKSQAYFYLLSTFHEDMHGEALMYSRQTLSYPPPKFLQHQPVQTLDSSKSDFPLKDVAIPEGSYVIGATEDIPFVFDNEKWAHLVEVAPYWISSTAVTNSQFQEFVNDGGYVKRHLWTPEGWEWKTKTNASHPLYWVMGNGSDWMVKWFDQTLPLEPYHPVVHVSWYEAMAYCKWANRRLPTEAEWEIAASSESTVADKSDNPQIGLYPWGDDFPNATLANLNCVNYGPIDVRALPAGESKFGCRQMIGNTWEWTGDPFWPYPGFILDPYKEYSAPWFGNHKVLRGGCWATRSRLIRNTWRNFYLPERRDIYAGFRTCTI